MKTKMCPTENVITIFFDWWNGAYREGSFSPEGFGRYFTSNALFVVDGTLRATGPEELNRHFQHIKKESDDVAIVTPVIATFTENALGFVRYRATFHDGVKFGAEECLAWVRLRGDLISEMEIFSRSA